MTNKGFLGMTPVLTSSAGSCMTGANWREAGVNSASFYLSSLLMKPGYDYLSTLPDLSTYVGWHDHLVLNASLPPPRADGLFALRSLYDGSRMSFSLEDILALLVILKPTMGILPQCGSQQSDVINQIVEMLPETIVPFFPVADVPESNVFKRPHGVYFSYDKKTSSTADLLQQRAQYKEIPHYIAGDLNLALMQALVRDGAICVESDLPAEDGCLGIVYCSQGDLSIQDSALSMQFTPIDADCHCPTCSQQLTRAYLHHLFEHTPLLCQRLLVQHNVHYCQAILA